MSFTAEIAAEMGRKGAETTNALLKQRKRDRELQRLADEKHAELVATYEGKTLMRVRLQLDKVFENFMSEARSANPDAAKLDRLASAQARLGEQERQLAGRPMPGSLKPTQGRQSSRKVTSAAEALSQDPAPPSPAPATDPNAPNG